MAIEEFIYPRHPNDRERLGVFEIPPYAEEMRISSAWIMKGDLFEVPDNGPIDSESWIDYMGAFRTDFPKGKWASWCINFYPFAGWQHAGATTRQTWGVIRVTTREGIWTPIPVTCRAATISVSPSPPALPEGDNLKQWSAYLQYVLEETQIIVEYRGIG